MLPLKTAASARQSHRLQLTRRPPKSPPIEPLAPPPPQPAVPPVLVVPLPPLTPPPPRRRRTCWSPPPPPPTAPPSRSPESVSPNPVPPAAPPVNCPEPPAGGRRSCKILRRHRAQLPRRRSGPCRRGCRRPPPRPRRPRCCAESPPPFHLVPPSTASTIRYLSRPRSRVAEYDVLGNDVCKVVHQQGHRRVLPRRRIRRQARFRRCRLARSPFTRDRPWIVMFPAYAVKIP